MKCFFQGSITWHKNKPCTERKGYEKKYQLYRTGYVTHFLKNALFHWEYFIIVIIILLAFNHIHAQVICDIAKKYAPEYDAEQILNEVLNTRTNKADH